MKKIILSIFIILSVFSQNVFCASGTESTEPVPYAKDEIPQWAKDIRDTEIYTFGSLPFVVLGVTLGYSFINVATHNFDSSYFVNPFTKEGEFSSDEMLTIIGTSSLISLGIGLTNLTITLIKRGIDKKNSQQKLSPNISVTAIDNKISIPPVPSKYLREKKYLYGNMENAVF